MTDNTKQGNFFNPLSHNKGSLQIYNSNQSHRQIGGKRIGCGKETMERARVGGGSGGV